MRAHALVLLVVLALVLPATPSSAPQSADADLGPGPSAGPSRRLRGRRAVVRREWPISSDAADRPARAAAAGPRRAGRRRHRHRRSRRAAAARPSTRAPTRCPARTSASSRSAVPPATAPVPCARWMRSRRSPDERRSGRTRRSSGPSAIPAGRLARASSPRRSAALSIEGGGPRLTRIEALERAAEAELKLGHPQDALDFYNRSLEPGRHPRLYGRDAVHHRHPRPARSGRTRWPPTAFERSSSITPTRRAPRRPRRTGRHGPRGTVSPLQAGMVRLNGSRLPGGGRPVRPGRPEQSGLGPGAARAVPRRCSSWATTDDARQGLEGVADERRRAQRRPRAAPARPARRARRRRGRRRGDVSAHGSRPRQIERAEAQFHIGFTRFVRGDRPGALAPGRRVWPAAHPPPRCRRSCCTGWQGSLPAGSAAAQDALNQAAAAAPETLLRSARPGAARVRR